MSAGLIPLVKLALRNRLLRSIIACIIRALMIATQQVICRVVAVVGILALLSVD